MFFSFFPLVQLIFFKFKKKHWTVFLILAFCCQPHSLNNNENTICVFLYMYCRYKYKNKNALGKRKKIIINRNIAHAPNILLKDRDDCRAGNFEFWNLIWSAGSGFRWEICQKNCYAKMLCKSKNRLESSLYIGKKIKIRQHSLVEFH